MDPNNTENNVKTEAPPPAPQHHANLATFLAILERFGVIVLTLAPAVAAPFASPQTAAILTAEAPVANALANLLQAQAQAQGVSGQRNL